MFEPTATPGNATSAWTCDDDLLALAYAVGVVAS